VISAANTEYQRLALESSNLLMEWDGQWVLGRYEQAALAALQAGRLRAQMGAILRDAGDWEGAAEDFLSAADCFVKASHREEGQNALDQARRMIAQEAAEAARPDLRQIARERDEALERLRQREQEVLDSFLARGYRPEVPDEDALRYLLPAVRDLPGLAPLHWFIFLQASKLGREQLAGKHLAWAAAFDPDNPDYAASLGYHLLERGERQRAIERGFTFLADHSDGAQAVRVMLAHALVPTPQASADDRERALAVLQPVIDDAAAEPRRRIGALVLSLILYYESGHREGVERTAQALQRIAATVRDDVQLRPLLAEARELVHDFGSRGNGAVPTDTALSTNRRDGLLRSSKRLNQGSVATSVA
jgi:hypothetical protein